MEKYLECVEGNSSKFWQLKVTGSKTHISYGKIGSAGQSQEKDHGSATAATKFAEKMIKEKEKKGYSEASAGTKREAPTAAARSGGTRRGRGGTRGSKRAKKKESEEEEEEKSESEDEDDAEGESSVPSGPVIWCVALTKARAGIYAIYVNDKGVYAGDEEGNVVELSYKDGKLQRAFKLPTGVKCIVGDGPFLYAGCNNGSLYDLTSGVPRLMCKLEAFHEVFWMDIKHGLLAAADSGPNVALVNGEGETVWSKKDNQGYRGWMCRMDDTGVYHGHSHGVVKYDLTGKKLWEQRDEKLHGILFGCQDADFVYPAASNVVKLDKKTGTIKREYEAYHPPSNAVSADGKWVIPSNPFVCYEGATGKKVWSLDLQVSHFSMAFYGADRLFGVGDSVVCYDVSPAAIAKATQGKYKAAPMQKLKLTAADVIAPSETVETTTDTSKGILCECVKEGSKLRVRITHKGYNSSWNVQFPQAIREAGAKYVVEQIIESKQGGFYRALGDIKKLAR